MRDANDHTSTPDLAPLNRIRVETALSRFPIHRLAKQGVISIDLKRMSAVGQADLQWKVSYNVDFGQPGPLAYKVDTLIVNRRIDEAQRPLPETIKLGSLREICRQLGFTDHNTDQIKKALHQNASAYITAKIRYKLRTGRERWGEIGYSRYSVVFTGETLPDGATADAVYIILNPSYRDLLNQVEVRPLDYTYLVELAPGPQRLYELLSFPMYGALNNGRPRAKLIYSDYCLYGPQTRYFEFDQVKKQMYKIHAPHRQSGYITNVEYKQLMGRDNNPDWEIFYTPGPKALAEYHAFTKRAVLEPATTSVRVWRPEALPPLPQQQSLALERTKCDASLLSELVRRGVIEKKARELLENVAAGQNVLDQIEWTDSIIAKAAVGKFHNPPGLYIAIIRDNIPPPQNFVSTRKRQLMQEAQQAKDAALARQAQLSMDYDEYCTRSLDEYVAGLPPQEREQMLTEARRQLRRTYPNMSSAQIEDLAANLMRGQVKNSGMAAMDSFEEFCR